jgi:hypothetical protein
MPLPAAIAEFMKSYKVGTDEIWAVPGGRAYAVKHAALERIAYEHNINFGLPQILEANGADGVVAMLVTATMGDFSTWSIGEAAPKNNKNAYAWAMAEKRAKDRCILKLLNIHGTLYSEDEADDFKRQEKGDLIPANNQTFTSNGKPKASNAIKKDNPARWNEIVEMLRGAVTLDELQEVGAMVKGEVANWPDNWRSLLADEYHECQTVLKQQHIRGAA